MVADESVDYGSTDRQKSMEFMVVGGKKFAEFEENIACFPNPQIGSNQNVCQIISKTFLTCAWSVHLAEPRR